MHSGTEPRPGIIAVGTDHGPDHAWTRCPVRSDHAPLVQVLAGCRQRDLLLGAFPAGREQTADKGRPCFAWRPVWR